MTDRQRLALAAPCTGRVTDRRYFALRDGYLTAVFVTRDAAHFEGRPYWVAAVSFQIREPIAGAVPLGDVKASPPERWVPMPTAQWSRQMRKATGRIAYDLLAHVGHDAMEDVMKAAEIGEKALHLRRVCSPNEVQALPWDWRRATSPLAVVGTPA